MKVCMFFQLHEPVSLKKFTVFDINKGRRYFEQKDFKANAARYLKANEALYGLIKKHKGAFRVSYSISGTAAEQMSKYSPELIKSFRKLQRTHCVEFLAETYHHSLSSLFSDSEFTKQVEMHKRLMMHLFSTEPKVFKNTELIITKEIAEKVRSMGFLGILSEDINNPHYLYETGGLRVLSRNRDLSLDLAVRFSQKDWTEYPLTPERYIGWIEKIDGDLLNLFMDYRDFSSQKGIHEFMEGFVDGMIAKGFSFINPQAAIKAFKPREAAVQNSLSWKGEATRFTGNQLQESALKELYTIEPQVAATNDIHLINDWRRLSESSYFEAMDTDSKKDAPYDMFIAYMNILNDLIIRINREMPMARPLSDRPSRLFSEA